MVIYWVERGHLQHQYCFQRRVRLMEHYRLPSVVLIVVLLVSHTQQVDLHTVQHSL